MQNGGKEGIDISGRLRNKTQTANLFNLQAIGGVCEPLHFRVLDRSFGQSWRQRDYPSDSLPAGAHGGPHK